MTRSIRLLDLIQALRRRRRPVSAATLADEMHVSRRTIYRDIGTLIAFGAPIVGEAGTGFVLRPGFILPPLMLTEEEVEALALGGMWVAQRADERLALAARNGLAKISTILPAPLTVRLENAALLAAPAQQARAAERFNPAVVRSAIRHEHRMQLSYVDEKGASTQRVVWPIALVYFDAVRVLVAWCEERGAFRHFRTDRIGAASELGIRYPRRRHALLKSWRETEMTSGRQLAGRDIVAGN